MNESEIQTRCVYKRFEDVFGSFVVSLHAYDYLCLDFIACVRMFVCACICVYMLRLCLCVYASVLVCFDPCVM